MDRSRDSCEPEATVIQLEEGQTVLAGRFARLLAFLIDGVFMAVVTRILGRLAGDSVLGGGVSAILFVALGIVQIILLVSRGQTLGKLIVKIAIVDQFDKEPPGFVRAALIRYLPQIIFSALYPPGATIYVAIDSLFIFGAERRCFHDRLAGTIVVKLGAAPVAVQTAAMPSAT